MFAARGIHCLSSGPTELALELFNLVRATPCAAIGQLESTRRATFLGGSSLRGQDSPVGAIPRSVIGSLSAEGPAYVRPF